MQDIQKTKPEIELDIQRVGITGLKLPIYISEKSGSQQHTVADIDVFVDLPAEAKGTHMSRLAIGVQKFMDHQLNKDLLVDIAEYIRKKCEATTCQVIYKFPYFIKRLAPISKEPGLIHCDVTFDVTKNDVTDFRMGIVTTTTSLCPCSKEISIGGGAHNQRSKISIKCNPEEGSWIWIEDIVKIAEQNSSSQIYSILKRTDEKFVTEQAYENPNFVEDMVRSIFSGLTEIDGIKGFIVEVSNEESIHQHNAYAKMSKKR